MSRAPSEIPKPIENLPRRAVLKGAVASPLALAVAAGQVSAGSLDPRLADVDRMIAQIEEALDVFNRRPPPDAVFDAEGDDLHELAETNWYAARDVLESYGKDLIARGRHSPADALILAKIADYWCVADEDNLSETPEYTCVRATISAVLSSAGVSLYHEPAQWQREWEERVAERKALATAPRPPHGYNAAQAIGRVRRVGGAVRAALTRECHIKDGTLKMHKAMAVTSSRYAELDALTAELIASQDWNPRDDFAILGALMLAYRDDWLTAPADEPASRVLQTMLKRARDVGDDLVTAAEGYRLRGGANV